MAFQRLTSSKDNLGISIFWLIGFSSLLHAQEWARNIPFPYWGSREYSSWYFRVSKGLKGYKWESLSVSWKIKGPFHLMIPFFSCYISHLSLCISQEFCKILLWGNKTGSMINISFSLYNTQDSIIMHILNNNCWMSEWIIVFELVIPLPFF